MLNGKLELYGVNVEALATSVLSKALQARSLPLDEFRREDLLADLIGYTWELSLRYDPDRDRAISEDRGRHPGFDGWATIWLRRRIVDWTRKTEGRTRWAFKDYVYERPLPTIVSLDAELAESLGSGRMDPAAHSDPDFRGALARGDSAQAWEAAEMGESDDGGTEGRAKAA